MIILLLLNIIPHAAIASEDLPFTNDDMVSYDNLYEKDNEINNNNGEIDTTIPEIEILRINNEFWSIVLLSGLCIISLIIVLGFIKQQSHSAKDIVNAAGLTLIIFGTIILVLVVNTSEQLTAAIGILGAIAGYLFRSVQSSDKTD